MAAFDLEEQERLDALKDWWKENGLVVYVAAAWAFCLRPEDRSDLRQVVARVRSTLTGQG